MDKVIRLVSVSHTSLFSGAEHDLLQLLTALENSVKPTVILPETSGRLHERLAANDIASVSISMPDWIGYALPPPSVRWWNQFYRAAQKLSALVDQLQPDLIHCNSLKATLMALVVARRRAVPLLWHMHDILNLNARNRLLVMALSRLVERIICVSFAVRENLVRLGAPPSSCEVIYNARYDDSFEAPKMPRGRFREELGISSDTPLVGLIGQLAAWKGQDILVSAAPGVISHFPDACLVMVGEPLTEEGKKYETRLREMVFELGLERNFRFCGFRDDIPAVMSDLDLLVHIPRKPDPFPLVLLEALELGCPVVASDIGGIPEIVIDGKTGLLTAPGDPSGLAEAIVTLLKHPAMGKTFRDNGREHLASRLNGKKNLQKVESILRSAIRASQ